MSWGNCMRCRLPYRLMSDGKLRDLRDHEAPYQIEVRGQVDVPGEADLPVMEEGPMPFPGEELEPTTWALPAEPGLEVKAVRDPVGELWVYGEGTWISDSGEHTWRYLVWREGPLTDATDEVEEA